MPTYNFRNNKTGEEYSEFMGISAVDDYLASNPDVVQLVNEPPGLVSGVAQKPDQGFRDLLKDMKKKHSGGYTKSSINTF